MNVDWAPAWAFASALARMHSGATGARSLDVLHCALVQTVARVPFLSTDKRQLEVARRIGIVICPI